MPPCVSYHPITLVLRIPPTAIRCDGSERGAWLVTAPATGYVTDAVLKSAKTERWEMVQNVE